LAYGTYHAVGGSAVSWHGFAEAIIAAGVRQRRLARAVPVLPIKTSDYPTPARRPSNSVLRPSAELSVMHEVEFDWALGLERAISKLDRLR
jgi:dTDP-4-dehydrorhamnose reductase